MTQTTVPEIKAGDLGAVAKLKDTLTNDTLGDKNDPLTFPAIKFPEPVLSYAIEPKSRGDEDKISTSMHRLEEEDPSIKYSRDAQTKELLLSGQGQLHIEVTVAKLKRRFGVDVNLKPPRIPYRETIKSVTEAHGRHKKQTGGHGQFGDCKIKVEPLPRGADFEFVDDIKVGATRQRLHLDLAVAELPVTSRLFLVTPMRFGHRLDRLAVRDARRFEVDVDAESPLQLRDGHLDVQLALS